VVGADDSSAVVGFEVGWAVVGLDVVGFEVGLMVGS
jgi:hypothetical protein